MKRCVLLGFLAVFTLLSAAETALDRYVAKKDPVYAWKLVRTIPGDGIRTHVLELTSQSWRTEKDVDRPVWKHWLTIVVPSRPANDKALLFIGGGNNNNPAPSRPSERTERIARETAAVVAELFMVPNQPLHFTDSPDKGRYEDDLIAYTRVKHFHTKDDTWLVRLAMVKSAVRAMDAIQEYLRTADAGRLQIDEFVVAGGSKRGWTAWLAGAVDGRVIAIMPLVIDALNSEAITRHHFEAYGFFSPALKDYVNHGLFPHKIGTPEYKAVLAIEDPYNYRNRPALKKPKYLINAAGDEFFLPDNSRFYFDALPQEKHLRYVPNAKHNLAGSDAVESMISFFQGVTSGKQRPLFSWSRESDGSVLIRTKEKPAAVTLWQATNPKTRDFRLDVIGPAYRPVAITQTTEGTYRAKPTKAEHGFTAYFVELTYPGPGKYPYKFTTEVTIAPDTLPYRWQDAREKYRATSGK